MVPYHNKGLIIVGFRFRKSVKILPGVRINFNKSSTSVSIGPKGLKHTISSTGRRTTTVGLPGTGLSYSTSSNKTDTAKNQPSSIPQSSTTKRRKIWIPIFLWIWSAYYLGFDLLALYYFLTGITTFQDFWVPEVFLKFFAGIVLAAIGVGIFVFQSRKKNIAKE